MLSDTRVTKEKSDKFQVRSDCFFIKTKYFPDCNIGISMWGKPVFKTSEEPWEWFETIRPRDIKNDAEKCANYIADMLNRDYAKPKKATFGVHLGGYYRQDEKIYPSMFHIVNITPDLKPREFIAQKDVVITGTETKMIHNGVHAPLHDIIDIINPKFEEIAQTLEMQLEQKGEIRKFISTERTEINRLIHHGEYYACLIKLVQAIIEIKGLVPVVGDPINMIVFNQEGLQHTTNLTSGGKTTTDRLDSKEEFLI